MKPLILMTTVWPKDIVVFLPIISRKDPKAFRNLDGGGSSDVQFIYIYIHFSSEYFIYIYFLKCYQIGPEYSRNLNS